MPPLPDPRQDPSRVFSRLETLGNNCELGIVQDAAGCTGPSLFKNAGFDHTSQLIDALDAGLAGMFDNGQFNVVRVPGWPDYGVQCKRFGFLFHTGLATEARHTQADLQSRIVAFRFMKAKLLDDLSTGDKILAYRHKTEFDLLLAKSLHAAIRRHGPAWLLYVREDPAPDSRFGWLRATDTDGMLFAALPRLSNENPPIINFPGWHKLACDALALRDIAIPNRLVSVLEVPHPPEGQANILTHGPAPADPFYSVRLPAQPGTLYTVSAQLWIPAAFPGPSLELVCLGYGSERFEAIDLTRRDQWQPIAVSARVPDGQSLLVPALRTAPGARGVLYTAGWSIQATP
jgi:hypothetical protein